MEDKSTSRSSNPTTSSSDSATASTSAIDEDTDSWEKEDIQLLYIYMKFNRQQEFATFFWQYPRSLYYKGEIPPVDHEGFKYNFLQVAVIFNYPVFVQLILDLLENPQLPKYYFSSKRKKLVSIKMLDILKMYLNTGSIQTGDTPLHFAAKLGYIDCCKILLSRPLCDMTVTNYDNLTPSEVICVSMKERSDETFEKIQALFNDGLFYVPVFRSNAGLQPIVGKPRKCKDFSSLERNFGVNFKRKIKERPLYILNAFAGPMPFEMADKFYNALKNRSLFTPEEQRQLLKIQLLEPNRGVERIARSFAKDLKLEWKEFFLPLEVFINLQENKGLDVFEKFCENREQYNLPSGSVPSSLDDENTMIVTKQMSLLRLYPSHVNPLCHRANFLYCYQKKFFEANAQDLTEDGDVAELLPSSSSEMREQSQTLESENNIFMNRLHLSDLDKDIYVSLKQVETSTYPKTEEWKCKIEAHLQTKVKEFPVNVDLFDPLNPIPVPKFRVSETDSVSHEENV
ncbi:Ankyrin repeat and LEM domain-containing [Argiope bruennichi]|uniref:Ankyrin repeat and LEM domain-containing n=1 Tax=Argiope bruennichi TaxID=94029 RepID=A0A8T0F7R4_ARGBR|nr:Ankyrin repeat and LEM domain-containing [Argiope bruennichi]